VHDREWMGEQCTRWALRRTVVRETPPEWNRESRDAAGYRVWQWWATQQVMVPRRGWVSRREGSPQGVGALRQGLEWRWAELAGETGRLDELWWTQGMVVVEMGMYARQSGHGVR
jgi:hypothetical protein